jgi:hypothetical protein
MSKPRSAAVIAVMSTTVLVETPVSTRCIVPSERSSASRPLPARH